MSKKHMKQVRQYTTGNRVANYLYNTSFLDAQREMQYGYLLTDFKKVLTEADIHTTYMPYLLGDYDNATGKITINPCMLLGNVNVKDTPFAQVVIHQLMRGSSVGDRVDAKGCDRDYTKKYYSDEEGIIPDRIATLGTEYLCEKYLCEYATKYLMDGLFIDRMDGADNYMVWLDKSIRKVYTDNKMSNDDADITIHQLHDLAIFYADNLASYCNVIQYFSTNKLQVS